VSFGSWTPTSGANLTPVYAPDTEAQWINTLNQEIADAQQGNMQYKWDSAVNKLDWMKEHFEISGGYEFSVGMQFGGGVKKYQAAYLNLGSTVVSELNISNKKERLLGNMYEPYEKNNYGFLASYLGGIEYKQEVVNYSKVHNIDIGIYTFGGQLVFDKDCSLGIHQ
jgi:hypothetical protein